MYMTVSEFNSIEKALQLLPNGEDFEALSENDQQTIIEAVIAMVNIYRKRQKHNKKTAKYIAEKRKIDKNYCR